MSSPAHPELIFGGALVGLNFDDEASVDSLLSTLRSYGVSAIDTAGRYPANTPGRSETLLGTADVGDSTKHDFSIDTKVLALGGKGDVAPQKSRASIETSLGRLRVGRVRTLYIHMPDTETAVDEQAKGLDKLYREGKFEKLGISNFSTAQVEEFIQACKNGGFVQPTVYQGEYNVIQRAAETELLPVLREHGIRYVAYRAIAAGFLRAGTFEAAGKVDGKGTRFEKGHPFAGVMEAIYGGDKAREAHELVMSAVEEAQVDPLDAALRWVCYHSALTKEDAVLLGASKETQLIKNVEAIRKGPLPQDVAEKLSRVWQALDGKKSG